MTSFKEQCIALRKKGYSITEITMATGRAKSSVYTHIRGIPLSEARLKQARKASGKWIRKFALARKGKSERTFRTFDAWSADAVLLTAHLLFDGEIARTRCAYNNRSSVLIGRVERLMREWYDFEPSRYYNKITGVSRVTYNNVALSFYLNEKSKELLRVIKEVSPNLRREFVRAFFDDEGCIDYRPEEGRRSIRGYQKDIRILKLIRDLLSDFGIHARVVRPNEVVIVGKDNLTSFEKEFNFSPGVYMNGNRSNSRWKKHMEKRELLRRAIKSFQH